MLLAAGYRVISYDRRGGGASSRPAGGYDFDTLAADLSILLETMGVQDAVLVGCCSGTGEVTRYLGTYGQLRVRAAALLAPLPPYLPRSEVNPEGACRGFLDEFLVALDDDRPAAIKSYLDRHYNIDQLGGVRVSDQAWQTSFHVAARVSAAAARGCAAAWLEDFRADVRRTTIPVLVVQGSQDRIMPPAPPETGSPRFSPMSAGPRYRTPGTRSSGHMRPRSTGGFSTSCGPSDAAAGRIAVNMRMVRRVLRTDHGWK